jgi:regulator-associated protein of mTOR
MNSQSAVNVDHSGVAFASNTPVTDRNSGFLLTTTRNAESSANTGGPDTPTFSQSRPTSAPGQNGRSGTPLYRGGAQDDTDTDREQPLTRRPKPLLLRAKSDLGPRGESPLDSPDRDSQDWGARHGFEDHYASEEYVSQLANVRCSFLCGLSFF